MSLLLLKNWNIFLSELWKDYFVYLEYIFMTFAALCLQSVNAFCWWTISAFWSKSHLFYSAASHRLYWACLSQYHLWWLASHLLFPYGCVMVTVSGFLEGSLIIVKMLVKLLERKRFVVQFFISFATSFFFWSHMLKCNIYLFNLFV